MKRLHVHVAVETLERSIGLCATVLGAAPAVVEVDLRKTLDETGHSIDTPRSA